jgi:hypothetical protein
LNQLVDLCEILYRDDDIEDVLNSSLFNAIASTIPKWRTFKLLRCVQLWTEWWIWMKFCMGGWWHWILLSVSLCRERRLISSSLKFLYIIQFSRALNTTGLQDLYGKHCYWRNARTGKWDLLHRIYLTFPTEVSIRMLITEWC